MEFGLTLGGSLLRPWKEDSELTAYQQGLELAVLAEQAGFRYVWMGEHHFLEEYSHSSAPELQLAAIAARTKRIRVGHAIVDMQYQINHPVRVAERVATLDLISNGRVEFGTGRGVGPMEWDGFGVKAEDTKGVWEEAVRSVLAMWQTERFSWDGKYIRIPGPRNVVPKPVQKPHPPIWMACTNYETAREAGQRGVGAMIFTFGGLDGIAERCRLYRDGLAHPKGRFSDTVNNNTHWSTGCLVSVDDKKSIDQYRASGRKLGELFARYWPATVAGTRKGQAAAEQSNQSQENDGSLVGDPQRVIELAHRAEDAGVSQIGCAMAPGVMPFQTLVRTIELMGEYVIPEFAHKKPVS